MLRDQGKKSCVRIGKTLSKDPNDSAMGSQLIPVTPNISIHNKNRRCWPCKAMGKVKTRDLETGGGGKTDSVVITRKFGVRLGQHPFVESPRLGGTSS